MDRPGPRRADRPPPGNPCRPDGRALVDDLLGRAVARTPLRFAPGQANSGAALEAVTLADGTRLVVKRFSAADDLLMRLTRDAGRAAALWTGGAFDRLPPAIDHATLAAAPEGDGWVLVMRDVGAALLGDERTLTRAESRRILTAAAAMHAAFAGERLAGLCAVLDWTTFMLPRVMEPWRGAPGGLPDWALRGWELFFDAAPADVAAAVAAIHNRPEALAAELGRCEPTLVHGDLSPANVGLTPDRVVVLDWALATGGPAALEVAAFLANFRWRVGSDPETILADARAAAGARHDERALGLALLATFANYGWLFVERAVAHPVRERRPWERVHLDWWVGRIREALATAWSPA